MARRMMALTCATALCLALGCAADKYRYAKDYAVETFADQFRCDASNVQAQQVENGWAVSGCGSSATCDVVRGTWGCQPAVAQAAGQAEAPHVRAWNAVATQSRCPRERVIPTRQSALGPADTLVQLDACGTPWSCRVVPGGVNCQPTSGAQATRAAPVAGAPDQPPPPPPPPPGASSRPPPPTAVPALSTGAPAATPPPPPGASSRPPPPTATPSTATPPPPPGAASRPPPPTGATPPPPTGATGAMTPEPWPGASAAPPASEDCVPRCRSGFVCRAGTCVAGCNPPCGPAMICYRNACISACNPPCEAGEQCTAQGECVRVR